MPRKREPLSVLSVEPQCCPEAVQLWGNATARRSKSDVTMKVKGHLAAEGWKFWYTMKSTNRTELRYESPTGKIYISLRTACKAYLQGQEQGGGGGPAAQVLFSESVGSNSVVETCSPRKSGRKRKIREPEKVDDGVDEDDDDEDFGVHQSGKRQKRGRGKVLADLKRIKKQKNGGGNNKNNKPSRVLRFRKKVREIVKNPDNATQIRNPRTILSWLIDSNAVLPYAKVYYRRKKGSEVPASTGQITREGIKCDCCSEVFGLSMFEKHAGSTNHRPSNFIILEDGRSLFDCQTTASRANSNLHNQDHEVKEERNDDICRVCLYGGDLILCDRCPSAYHTGCLGLKDLAEGDWFCPSCSCGTCGHGRFEPAADTSRNPKDDGILVCDQCDHKYHVGCLRNAGLEKLERESKEKWFCSRKCEDISQGIKKILGKPILVGSENLTWTLIKPCSPTDSDVEDFTENYSKLNVALSVMHECFEPAMDPHTNRDIAEDIIFNRESELSRLKYGRFYTVILERDEEVISVGNVRIYSEVAEVPLVATRFQFRRLGMCRIWMDELEKQLMELGVEKLTLPSASCTLETWTSSSFGFSEVTAEKRLEYLKYPLMDFQGTIMCHKLLKQSSITQSTGAVSTVTQAEHIQLEKGAIDQEPGDVSKPGLEFPEDDIDRILLDPSFSIFLNFD